MILHRDMDNSIHCIRLQGQKHHQRYLCKIVLTIQLLELELYFVNYNPVLRSYDCILGVKIVLFLQHSDYFSDLHELLCNRQHYIWTVACLVTTMFCTVYDSIATLLRTIVNCVAKKFEKWKT